MSVSTAVRRSFEVTYFYDWNSCYMPRTAKDNQCPHWMNYTVLQPFSKIPHLRCLRSPAPASTGVWSMIANCTSLCPCVKVTSTGFRSQAPWNIQADPCTQLKCTLFLEEGLDDVHVNKARVVWVIDLLSAVSQWLQPVQHAEPIEYAYICMQFIKKRAHGSVSSQYQKLNSWTTLFLTLLLQEVCQRWRPFPRSAEFTRAVSGRMQNTPNLAVTKWIETHDDENGKKAEQNAEYSPTKVWRNHSGWLGSRLDLGSAEQSYQT